MFTPGLMFAPALTSVLLMPTFASTPTFGLTFTPPEGEVVELALDGLEEPPEPEGELDPAAEGERDHARVRRRGRGTWVRRVCRSRWTGSAACSGPWLTTGWWSSRSGSRSRRSIRSGRPCQR